MASLGEQLRRGREARDLTIEEAAAVTHIPRGHLMALEADDLDSLPGPPFTPGFVRIYADALHLPAEVLVDAYHEQTGNATPSTFNTYRRTRFGKRAVLLATTLTVTLGIVIMLLITNNASDNSSNGQASVAGNAVEPSAVRRGSLFELLALNQAQVRITADGRTLVDQTMPPGEIRRWSPQRETLIEVSASASVKLTIDGEAVMLRATAGKPVRGAWYVDVPTAAPIAPRPTGT